MGDTIRNFFKETFRVKEKPIQRDKPLFDFSAMSVQSSDLINADLARLTFGVAGNGLTAAILDSGINRKHVDFHDKILTEVNFTNDNDSDFDDANDRFGHGTNVAGIIAANGDHIGVAPGANIVPIKVLTNTGNGNFEWLADGLQWVVDNYNDHNISVICVSLGDDSNLQSDIDLDDDEIIILIRKLKNLGIPTVIAAGNLFALNHSEQGMTYPAISRHCISVGAIYDDNEGAIKYPAYNAFAKSTGPDRITPFSQRLHTRINGEYGTDFFAPGAPVSSSGINGENGESTESGTSQAAPMVCGVILLLQELIFMMRGELPDFTELMLILTFGSIVITDGDDEDDNVTNTQDSFLRIDANKSLRFAMKMEHKRELAKSGLIEIEN